MKAGSNTSTVALRAVESDEKVTLFYRVLTMVYNTQNYWVFGLCPSSGF
jgi:hypothetical protein